MGKDCVFGQLVFWNDGSRESFRVVEPNVIVFPMVNTIGRGTGDAFADARDKLDVWAREPIWARGEFLGEVAEENERGGHGSGDDSTSPRWAA